MSKYWRIDKQSAPTLGVKTLIPNSHLICRFQRTKDGRNSFQTRVRQKGHAMCYIDTIRWIDSYFDSFDSAPLLGFYINFTRNGLKNEVSKILCVHTSYKPLNPPLILNPREPTLNRFLFWFFWFGALIRILHQFYPKWIKNEVSKIPCVHTSYKHQIPPRNVFFSHTESKPLEANRLVRSSYRPAYKRPNQWQMRVKMRHPWQDQQPAPSYCMPSHFTTTLPSKNIIGTIPTNNSSR